MIAPTDLPDIIFTMAVLSAVFCVLLVLLVDLVPRVYQEAKDWLKPDTTPRTNVVDLESRRRELLHIASSNHQSKKGPA